MTAKLFPLPDHFSRIGLFGGSFDPPHRGHLESARRAADELALDQLAFVPAAHPPHKSKRTLSSFDLRRQMLELCLSLDERFRLCLIEKEASLPGTTLETILKLRRQGFTEERCHLIWLMGSDALQDLNAWHEPQKLLESVEVAVLPRPGYPASEAKAQFLANVRLLSTPLLDISAHEIRSHELSLEDAVIPAVAQFIRRQGLYGYI